MFKYTKCGYSQNIFALRHLVVALMPHMQWRHHGIGVLQGYVRESSHSPELRIHVWSTELMRPGIQLSGNAHNHRFKLRSTVLCGALEHTEWQVRSGEGFEFYDFVHARLHTDENRSDMRKLPGEVGVDEEKILFLQGSVYEFDRSAFHTSVPKSLGPVVTVVEKHDQREEKAQVLAPTHTPPVPSFSNEQLPQSTIDEIVRDAIAALAKD